MGDDSDSGSGSSGMMNLTALLSGTDSLSSLNDLVGNYPDFAATLASWEDVTILAPSNDALETLMNSDAGSMLDNDEFVQSLLRYHVLNGTVYSSNITQTPIFAPTYLNSSMYSNVTGGQVVAAQMEDGEAQFVSGLKQVSTVSEANVNYTNGVVHIIEGTVAYSSDLSNTSLTTLQGDDVEITIANGAVMVNNATVTNANILFAGGVIHVIDQVLNPNSNSSSSSSNSTSSDSDSDNAFGATSSASEVPFTSGQPTPTTTFTELVTSTSQVIVSQTPNGGAGGADSDSS